MCKIFIMCTELLLVKHKLGDVPSNTAYALKSRGALTLYSDKRHHHN